MAGNYKNKGSKELMKIGITCYPSVGGSGIIATELGKLLAENGHEIHFITSSLPFRLDKVHSKIFFHQVEVNHYPVFQYPPYDLALASKMAEIIDQENLDILHVHYAIPHAICAILAREMAEHKVKVVTTLHGTDITVLGIDDTFKKMIRYGIEKSDAVTSVSESLLEQTKVMIGTDYPIQVIYNFVNEKEYYPLKEPSLKEQYEIKREEKVVVHISNFRKVKRVPDVIHTFEKINREIPSKLLLIGDGPEYSKVKKLVNELGLDEQVLFLGKQNNISELLAMSDLMLLLSEKESFGLVLLEAMACGVPGIGTNVGGIPEVLSHGKTGYIVEKGDLDMAANYALTILKNDHVQEQFSNQAIKHVNDVFKSEIIVEQYLNLYQSLLN
jgi:N-acetyl-alpha-D-glucosaminyl L-malate synthase BshA